MYVDLVMKNLKELTSKNEQAIITDHYGLDESKLTEAPGSVTHPAIGETEVVLHDGTRITIYDQAEPLVEAPGTWDAETE